MSLFSPNGAFSFLVGGNGNENQEEVVQRLTRAQIIHRDNERSNFTILTKTILRRLIEDAMSSSNRLIEGDSQTLSDLLTISERILFHGFKSSMRNAIIPLRNPDAELWAMIVRIGKVSEPLKEAVSCIDRLENLKTSISKIRGMLRLTMMQKKAHDFFNAIVSFQSLKDFYESWAFLRSEEAVVLCGGLLGLRSIDFNLVLEFENLQDQPLSVELANYMKLPTVSTEESEGSGEGKEGEVNEKKKFEKERKVLLDQNNYLEERIRQLETNLDEAKRKIEIGQEAKSEIQFDSFKGVSYRASTEKEEESPSSSGASQPLKFAANIFEMEKELKSLRLEKEELATKVVELEDTLGLTEQQVVDKTKVCSDLYEKLRLSEEVIKKFEGDFLKLKDYYTADNNSICKELKEAEKKIDDLTKRINEKGESDDYLRSEFQKKCDQYGSSISNLEAKQKLLSEAEIRIATLEQELKTAKLELIEFEALNKENAELKEKLKAETERAQDREKTLEEMGKGLSESKLRMVELTEELSPLSDAQWANDSDVHNCSSCAEAFTLTKRKHHCRKCGSIFCSTCSECRIKLPSNPKPARVCDNCFIILQKMSSSKSPRK